MEWYERWFGEEYLMVYDHRDIEEAEREVGTIKEVLALRGNELVLDLCCGYGRHDVPLARIGCRVLGLDYSRKMLDMARASRPPGERYPQYILADARTTVFREGVFDCVINLFTSFGYFEDEENSEFLRSIARLLRHGGGFYIDYLNPPRVLDTLVEESSREKDDMHIVERRQFNPETHRIEKTIILHRDADTREFRESVRLYDRDEMLGMLSDAGLSTADILGSVDGEPYSEGSERMILYGMKKA